MKPYQKLILAFAAIVLLACILSPIVKPLADRHVPESKTLTKKLDYDPEAGTYDFGKIYRRLLMVAAIVVLIAARRTLEIGPMAKLGFRAPGAKRLYGLRNLAAGASVGIVSIAAFMIALYLLGAALRKTDRHAADFLPDLVKFVLQASLIGLFEETIFRGFVFQTLMKDMRFLFAAVLSSALYSALHFFDAHVIVGMGVDPLVGFRCLAVCFAPIVSDPAIIPASLGLFLLGMVFAYAYRWTQSLYLPIALHASWVFALKASGKLFHLGVARPEWLYGSKQIVDGVMGCIFLVAVFGLLWAIYGRSLEEKSEANPKSKIQNPK